MFTAIEHGGGKEPAGIHLVSEACHRLQCLRHDLLNAVANQTASPAIFPCREGIWDRGPAYTSRSGA